MGRKTVEAPEISQPPVAGSFVRKILSSTPKHARMPQMSNV